MDLPENHSCESQENKSTSTAPPAIWTLASREVHFHANLSFVLSAGSTSDKRMQAGDRRLLRGTGLQIMMLALTGIALFWAGYISSLPDTTRAVRAHLNWHPQGQSICLL